MKQNTMRYWHKLEHFYPYMLEEQHNDKIKTFYIKEQEDFPDMENPLLPPKMQVRYYEVYLGIFKVDSALEILAEKMQAEKEFRDESDETSCFCKFRLSPNGIFDEKSFKISSFPWAIQRVQKQHIDMEEWDEKFYTFQKEFFMRFFKEHEVITYDILKDNLEHIAKEIDWRIEFDDCWMRIDRVIGEMQQGSESVAKENEEEKSENDIVDELIKNNDLLNSFYVRDLEKINQQINKGNYGEALDEYIDHQSREYINIEDNKEMLFKIFNPEYLPKGKWPSGFPLRAMQQVAVNLAMNEELYPKKVFSVNGPPGTGKTTLLRDIIAAKVVERAEVLMELKIPDDAFVKEVGTVKYRNFISHVKELSPEIKEHGILVASNNNAAVKNITMELPLKKSIQSQYHKEYDYFSQVSDRILNQETWGICAAVLGNKRNREAFIDDFWPISDNQKDKYDFNLYLRKLHTGEKKRTSQEREENWEKAKEKFKTVSTQVKEIYAQLNNCYKEIKTVNELQEKIEQQKVEHTNILYEKDTLEKKKCEMEEAILELEVSIKQKTSLMSEIKTSTIFFYIKYLLKNGMQEFKSLEREVADAIKEKRKLACMLEQKQRELKRCEQKLYVFEKRKKEMEEELYQRQTFIDEWKKKYGVTIPDDTYLSNLINEKDKKLRKDAHCDTPWNGKEFITLREKLFLEAMELHKAFVENSVQMRIQLDTFGKMMRDMLTPAEAEILTTPLIQSFQLVVPVISTTFASVGSFLRRADRDTFGLLLIDEAGQALPQSAPGAIWRSKKCIVVGDPLQIEPVVTIHDKTIQFLKKHFKQSDFIASKDTSVQSLADCCNQYGGYRYYGERKLWIGSPLLVHGRCQKSIFDIANKIAYNEKMIYGTSTKEGAVCVWKHVAGSSINKHYVKEQAEAILPLVKKEFNDAWEQEKPHPSLFIISPFRSVKTGLIYYFAKYDFLCYQLGVQDDKEKRKQIHNWIYSNIGTIHTFQGKEADMVIICLGVDSGDKGGGAVQWAGERPNILNVAVTRAKNRLYIVGDVNKWTRQEFFEVAHSICIRKTTSSDVNEPR